MKTISTIDMPKSEWLRHRQSFIGGSESAAVFGLNEYMSPVDVYLSKIAAEPIDIPVNDIMQSGNDAELFMPQWYEAQTGFRVERDFNIRIHKEIDYIGVNLDGIISDPNHKTPGVLEIKTTNPEEVESWNNKLPYRHALQVHHGMLVTGWTWAVVIVLVRDKYAWQKLAFPVDYSAQVQKLQIEAYDDFWN
ncbi:MAG: YqaJ viral recombinase family protein, partial [bacterium]